MDKSESRLIEGIVFFVVIFVLVIGTYSRNTLWNDELVLYADVAKKSPNKARAFVNLGFAYFNKEDYRNSQEMSRRALELDPKSSYAYFNLSLCSQKLGDLNEAVELGKKAVEIDPEFTMGNYSLGKILLQRGQFDEAENAFQKIIRKYPYFPEVHNLMGIVYASRKQYDKTVEEMELDIRTNPNPAYQARIHSNLGILYWLHFRNREKAIYHLRAALRLDPDIPNREPMRKMVYALEQPLPGLDGF
jgi:tetratricopeptide (TPR) repeat protein